MNKKILFALLSTTILSHNLLGLDCTCTTTTEERAALETRAPIAAVEQQRFSQPDLFSFPFFEPLTDSSPALSRTWVENAKKKQDALKGIIAAGFAKKIGFIRCGDQTSDEAMSMIHEAKAHFLSAAKGGSDKAMIFLSDIYRDEGNFIEAFYWCLLGIEVEWIINGSISDTNYKSFQDLCERNEIEKNTEASAIAPVIHQLRAESIIPTVLNRVMDISSIAVIQQNRKSRDMIHIMNGLRLNNTTSKTFDRLLKVADKNAHYYQKNPFIAIEQIKGLSRITNDSETWRQYFICLDDPSVLPELAIDSIEKEREKYKIAIHMNKHALMANILIKHPSLFAEFHPDLKDKSIYNFIGDLFWKETKQTSNLIEIKNLQSLSYYSLFVLIYENRYSFDFEGRTISPENRKKFAIKLLKKSLKITSYYSLSLSKLAEFAVMKKISMESVMTFLKKAIDDQENKSELAFNILTDLISIHKSDVDERGKKISSKKERDIALARISRQAIKKGFPIFSGILGHLIISGDIKHDENDMLIPAKEKINTGIQLYYRALKYISQLDPENQKIYNIDKSNIQQNIGIFIARKIINTDENNQIVSNEDRSAVCARIFNECILLNNSNNRNTKFAFICHILWEKINHQLDGTPITSKAQRHEYASTLLREEIQERPDNILAMYQLILMIYNNQTNCDENNNIISPQDKLDWMIEKLSLKKMQYHIESQIVRYQVLLQKEYSLETKKKLYDLVQTAVIQGKTSYFRLMEALKNSIEIDEKESDPSIPQIQTDDDSSSSSNHDSDSDSDEEMTHTSTSHVETGAETSQERALRKAQAKANRLLKSQRLLPSDKTKDFLKKHIAQLRKTDDGLIHQKPQKYELLWKKEARSGFDNLLPAHRSNVRDIIDHIKNSKNPYEGAEKLKDDLQGWYSHRISDEHRFVFKINSDNNKQIIIRSCYTHYKK